MKKLVIAALAIGTMAACTKSNVQYEQPGEISFQPVTQKATKATTSVDQDYPEDGKFNVWAWWVSSEASTTTYPAAGKYTSYINEGTFAKKENTWGGYDSENKKEKPYYWPTTGSLFFAGYSPANASGTKNYVLETQTLNISNYQQPSDISSTVDLMWFNVTDKSYDQNDAARNGVPVVFKHALSWLTFKFNLENNSTEKSWTITNVELKEVETTGTFKAVKGSEPEWTGLKDAKSMNVYNGSKQLEFISGGTVLENTSDASEKQGNVVVIPQPCAKDAVSLEITFDFATPAGTTIEDQKVTLPLSTKNVINNGTSTEDLDDDCWLVGKHYIYTIIFGADEILIAPTVENWDEVTEDINAKIY